jgi:hypothetical protein
VCLDWFDAVPQHGPWDLVVADGSFNCLGTTDRVQSLIELLHRHMRAGAQVVTRCFTEPERRESPAEVFHRLHSGAYASFHIFKFHLAMSLQTAAGSGVVLADVWERWSTAAIDEQELHCATGWPIEEIRTIHTHRGARNRLWFPALRQMRSLLEQQFHLETLAVPEYEMGDRCPMFTLRRS